MTDGLLKRKLVIVSGKGGVGKSTVSAGLARLAAGLSHRVLVVQSDPNVDAPVNLHNILGSAPFDMQEKELLPNLWAIHIDPEIAMEHAFLSVVPSRFLYRHFFGNDMVRGIMDAVPGLREAFIIHHVHSLTVAGALRRHYDLVIWDAPPTGHLPLYLKAPEILSRMFNRGYVNKVLNGLTAFLRDADSVALCLVTLPEETPVSETVQLAKLLREEALVHLGGLVVNEFPQALLDDKEEAEYRGLLLAPEVRVGFEKWIDREVLARWQSSDRSPDTTGLGHVLLLTAERQRQLGSMASDLIRPLAALGLPQWTLPWFPMGRVTLPEVDQFVSIWKGDPAILRHLLGERCLYATEPDR